MKQEYRSEVYEFRINHRERRFIKPSYQFLDLEKELVNPDLKRPLKIEYHL